MEFPFADRPTAMQPSPDHAPGILKRRILQPLSQQQLERIQFDRRDERRSTVDLSYGDQQLFSTSTPRGNPSSRAKSPEGRARTPEGRAKPPEGPSKESRNRQETLNRIKSLRSTKKRAERADHLNQGANKAHKIDQVDED